MKNLLLSGLSVVGVVLATWASQSGPAVPAGGSVDQHVPPSFGPIQPRISADGARIAFSWQGAIWTIPREGGPMVRLSRGAGFDMEPAWSPDGKLIAFVNSPRMAGGPLQVIRADGGEAVPLTAPVEVLDPVSYSKLDFHPDGRLLGHFRIAGKDAALMLLDLATGQSTAVVKPHRSARYALSRDGNWLAYTSPMDVDGQQWGNDGPQADLWKVATAGGEPVKLVRFPSRVHDLCWSADGRELFVVSELGGAHYNLWQVPLSEPDRARRVSFGQADEDRPSVSADGRWLTYTDNRGGCTSLVVRDLASGLDSTIPVRGIDFGEPSGSLRIVTRDKGTGRPVVARVSIQQVGGKFHAPAGSLHRVLDDAGHFYCDAAARLTLPAGEYRLRAFHGPEFRATHVSFAIAAEDQKTIEVDLERWTDPAARGWHSGENHIHANYGYGQWYCSPQTMLEQCAGENLRVCNFMVANSDTDGVFDREFFRGRPDPFSTDETILYWNQEFRSTHWGHMTLINLSQVVEPVFTGFLDTTNPWDAPTNSDVADRTHLQKGGLVNYTHGAQNASDPYLGAYTAKGIPVDVALGKIDTMDLNASYAGTVPLWYRLLNCGFRIPPSAGTDCFLNRIRSRLPGGDRVYVKIDGAFSYAAWIDGLRAGRSFVTSGPILELAVEDQGPGSTIRLGGPREVRVVARATSQFPLSSMEIVFNGKVVKTCSLSPDGLSAEIDTPISVPRSGWISLRASGKVHPDHSGGPLEAHASPVHLLVGDQPVASREDAEYFLAWIERLSLATRLRQRIPSPELKQHVEKQLESARAVYAKIAQGSP